MKSTLNNACISALLCGAVIIATPALAQLGAGAGASGVVGTPATGAVNPAASAGISGSVNTPAGSASATMNNRVNPGASVSTGVSASGDVNSADASGNAASVNLSTQTPAARMSARARAAADSAEAATTRQLNQQATVNARGTASTTVQQ